MRKPWARRCIEREKRREHLAKTGGYGSPSRFTRAAWAGERTLPELLDFLKAKEAK